MTKKELIKKLEDVPDDYDILISHHRYEHFPLYLKDKKWLDSNFIIQWTIDSRKEVILS